MRALSLAASEQPGFPNESPSSRALHVVIPKIAAKAASTVIPGGIIPYTGFVTAAALASLADIAESATEYAIYEVLVWNAAGVANAAAAATYTTKKEAASKEKLVAHIAKPLTLSGTEANLAVEAGGFIAVKVSGTEMKEDTGGILRVTLSRVVRATPALRYG